MFGFFSVEGDSTCEAADGVESRRSRSSLWLISIEILLEPKRLPSFAIVLINHGTRREAER